MEKKPTAVFKTELCLFVGCPVAFDSADGPPTEHSDVCRVLSCRRPGGFPPPMPPRNAPYSRAVAPPVPPRNAAAVAAGQRDLRAPRSSDHALDDRPAPLGRPVLTPGPDTMSLMFDSRVNQPDLPRVLLYTNPRCLRALSRSRHWFADGSFPRVNGSRQYAVYAVTECCENYRALIQVFMANRSVETYRRLFRVIKLLLPSNTPDPELMIVHLKNTEMSAIEAVWSVFPTARVRACLQHTTRTVWIMARRYRVPEHLITTDENRKQLERLLVMVIADPGDLRTWFDAVTGQPFYREHAAELARFLEWFRDTYIGGPDGQPPHFPANIWNYHDAVVLGRPVAADPPDEFAADAVAVGLPRFFRQRGLSRMLRSLASPAELDCDSD